MSRQLRLLLIVLVGGLAGYALLTAYRVSRDTGKSMGESLADVPSEASRTLDELRGRAIRAVHVGLQASRQKQAEIQEKLATPAQAS